MRRLYSAIVAVLVAATASAQVSVEAATPKEQLKFNNEVKTETQKPGFMSEAQRRGERAAIRKERNTIEFNAGLNGSFSHFNENWRAVNGNTNSITAIANILFTHSFKKNLFTLDNKVTGKIGYTVKGLARGAENDLTKSQDEWYISTAPAYKMSKDWNFGAIVSLRSQFANGFNDKDKITSQFFSPAYFNVSVGFTYVCPKEKFPIKINLSPISMNSTFVTSDRVKEFFYNEKAFTNAEGAAVSYAEYLANPQALSAANRNVAYAYGLTLANGSARYEGGSSIQIDFDRTFGKKGIFRYRTTLYSFYGWINEVMQQTGKNYKDLNLEHLAPNVRWENTIDIKATKYFSTQFYFQMYYNKAQCPSVQTQIILGVGLSYTFKNK
ncbi:MAG: DUF3078 domain-containing protein [Alistipes sp.]|nr:DUF3078 domain-containing protein [Alistipes sp.]